MRYGRIWGRLGMIYKLIDIMDLIGGGTPKTSREEYWNGDIPWISVKDFNNNLRYVYKTEKSITKKGLENSSAKLLHKGDMIISARGTVGEIASLPFDMSFNQSCYGLRARKNIVTNDFLYYLIKYKISDLKRQSHGSVFDTITRDTFRGIEVNIPCIENQYKIANILSKLDYKIELNNQINRNLSELLNLMYKNDYLDEVVNHKDWIEVTINDITSKFATGLNPRKNFVLGHGENYYVTIKNMNNNRVYLDSKCDMVDDDALVKINKRSDLQVGDLLFSGIGTIGRVHLIDEPPTNWNISESIFTMRPSKVVTSEFLYLLLLSYDMQDYALSLASGSVQKGIRMADLKRYKLYLPSKEDMDRLTFTWKPFIDQIKKFERENDELAILRDTLLRKLMSGELDVSNLDI